MIILFMGPATVFGLLTSGQAGPAFLAFVGIISFTSFAYLRLSNLLATFNTSAELLVEIGYITAFYFLIVLTFFNGANSLLVLPAGGAPGIPPVVPPAIPGGAAPGGAAPGVAGVLPAGGVLPAVPAVPKHVVLHNAIVNFARTQTGWATLAVPRAYMLVFGTPASAFALLCFLIEKLLGIAMWDHTLGRLFGVFTWLLSYMPSLMRAVAPAAPAVAAPVFDANQMLALMQQLAANPALAAAAAAGAAAGGPGAPTPTPTP